MHVCLRYSAYTFFLAASICSAAVNAGIVQGIWLSHREAFVGDTVTLYAAVQNQANNAIAGSVTFFSKDAEIGKTHFSVLPNELKRVSVPFSVTYGMQNLTAKVALDGEETPISISTPIDSIFIDNDTDKDKIGNQKDTDDDNDGIVDTEETRLGTNPEAADSDSDGLSDAKEIELHTNPRAEDTDKDGLGDAKEVALRTDPKNPDTDGDGVNDGDEQTHGTNPNTPNIPSTKPSDTPSSSESTPSTSAPVSTLVSVTSGSVSTAHTLAVGTSGIVSPLASSAADLMEHTARALAPLESTPTSTPSARTKNQTPTEISTTAVTPYSTLVSERTERVTQASSHHPLSGILTGVTHTLTSLLETVVLADAPWYKKILAALLMFLSFFVRWWLWTLCAVLLLWGYIWFRRNNKDYQNPA